MLKRLIYGKGLNSLKPVRPMVFTYQLPWRELNVNDELTLRCEDEWARGEEKSFRETLYRWEHMRDDHVVEPFYYVTQVRHSTGIGIRADVDQIPHDQNGGTSSKHYNAVIANEEDIEKIQMPVVTLDQVETERRMERATELFGDILDVRSSGVTKHNYAPWDRLAEWCNPQEILMDLAMRPDFMHKLIGRLTDAHMTELDQLEALNALTVGTGNAIIGQGGLGFIDELPQKDCDPENVRLIDQWGGSMAQIFSEVSPDMHEEFALQYEAKYLKRFGLCYYGCCEPLHHKVDISAKHIPNLRKISMSPWVDAEKGASAIAGRFVFSFKPNPAFLATDKQWDCRSAEAEIRTVLEITKGTAAELILKDVSTVRFEPERLWAWTEMVMSMAKEYEDQ